MSIRVLVIDDDPGTLCILEAFLTGKGAEVVTSDFPPNIADLVGKVQPDVLLLDLVSSTDSLLGVTMLGRLYDALQDALSLPVLLMSADHAWLSLLKDSLRDVGVTVVPKPFEFEQLWQTIEQAALSA